MEGTKEKDIWRKMLGRNGEDIACLMLQERGFRILDRNFRYGRQEIDIVCLDGTALRFVEVKTRREPVEGEAWEAVTPAKMRNIGRAAQRYLDSFRSRRSGRTGPRIPDIEEIFFDIVTVVWDEDMVNYSLEYIQDAFRLLYV